MHYYLVQRLMRKRDPRDEPSPFEMNHASDSAFDDLFGAEYMGSSEFGFELRPAYQRMCKSSLTMTTAEVTRNGVTRTVHFIAPDGTHGEKIGQFKEWLAEPRLRSKEATYFDLHFERSDETDRLGKETMAWWSFDDDVAWTLDESIANDLLKAFGAKVAA